MKQKNLILMVVAVGCGLVAAFLTTQINAKPKVELVEVWVAAKDLPVGTVFTKTEMLKLVTKKKMNKDSLPPAFVLNEEEFYDKRLTRSVLKDETFNPATLSKGGVITLPAGHDLVTMPINPTAGVAGFVTPGSRVDVLATLRMGNKTLAFPLLVNMLVLAVDQNVDISKQANGTFPNMSSVSFAATQEQALLLSLAKSRGCSLELLLRNIDKPLDPDYDIKKVIALMQDDKHHVKVNKTEGYRGEDETPLSPLVPIEAPREKVEVWRAIADIPANTEITKELVATKLQKYSLEKELAEGAYSDLTVLIDQKLTLKKELSKGQWITSSLVGPPLSAKGAFEVPKPPPPVVAARRVMDVPVTTPNGTKYHRFEEVAPGRWLFKAELSPEEAFRSYPKEQPPAPK